MSFQSKGLSRVIGLAIVMSGLPVAWVLRNYVGAPGSQGVSIAVMLTGTALIVRWREILFLRVYGSSPLALLPLMYLLPVAFVGLMAGPQGDEGTFHLIYCAALLIAILSSPLAHFNALPRAVAVVSVLSAILTLWHVFFGDFWLTAKEIGDEGNRLYAGDSNNPNFIAFVGGYGLIGLLLSIPSRRTFPYLVVAVTCGTILGLVIFMSTTRSVIVGLAFAAAVGIFVNRKMLIRTVVRFPLRIAKVVAIAIAALVIASFLYRPFTEIGDIDTFSLLLGQIGESMLSGLQGILLGHDITDQSTLDRLELRNQAITSLNIVGNGYASMYVDNPILQGFTDLGILGGLFFVFVTLIVPFNRMLHVFRKDEGSHAVRFAVYVYLFNLPNLFLHGRPYDFALWIPIVLFYALCFRKFSRQGKPAFHSGADRDDSLMKMS